MSTSTSEHPLRILHLEDNPEDAELIHSLLAQAGLCLSVQRVVTQEDFEQALAAAAFDIILSDVNLPAFDGISALRLTRQRDASVPFVFVSGSIGEEVAIETLKNGATDYVLKDRAERLVPAVKRALEEAVERRKLKAAEQALAAANAQFKVMVETLPIGVFLSDSAGACIYTNPAYQHITGCRFDDALGNGWVQLIHPEERQRVVERWTAAVKAGRSYEALTRYAPQEKPEVLSQVTIAPIPGADGRNGFVGTVEDITARRAAEERIREQAALLDHARDAICVTDLDQRILYWNRSAERLYGWTPQEALGQDANQLLFSATPDAPVEALKNLINAGEWQGELRQVRRNKEEIIVESRWTLVRDDRDTPKSILVINTDITERKQIESQFLRVQRMESIGTLAGGIAHDLNNILAPILMSAQMLRLKCASPDDAQWLGTIEAAAQRGADLVKQIVSFARGSEGRKVVLQPRHLVNDLLKVLQRTMPRSIELNTRVPKDLWTVLGDSTQIYQVLMNLSVNARDAMPNGGRMVIEVANMHLDEHFTRLHLEAKPGRYVTISVTDTGTGIPPKVLDRVFDPFFTTKELGKGTGLGLAMVLSITRGHGGFVTVYSEMNKGTTFRIYIPASQEDEPAETSGPITLPRGQGELVLVADDEPAILDVTCTSLERTGYRVLRAGDGVEAIAIFARHIGAVAAVITDMAMPLMDGPAMIRAVRRLDPKVAILAVSGMIENHLPDEGLPAVTYLKKPYTMEALLLQVHEILRAARAQGASPGKETPPQRDASSNDDA